MTAYRKIKKITKGIRTQDGAGVKLVRVVGYNDTGDYDPFLMLDAFDSENPEDYTKGFPWHPHRGIETITYLIEGEIEHGDSLGNKGVIGGGDAQWMTAGSGIIHQEMPQAAPRMLGAQLWLNLPAADKMADPQYGDIKKADIPVIAEDGARVHVISGSYKGRVGAFQGRYIPATYLDVEVAAGAGWVLEGQPEDTLFVYLVSGSAAFEPGGRPVADHQAVLFEPGDALYVEAGAGDLRFLLLTAPPLDEPVAWGGPIVMNTRDELNQAFRELDEGTFIRVGEARE